MKGLTDKRILITGSTRGIGHAAARRFIVEGATVLIHGRQALAVQAAVADLSLAEGPAVTGFSGDLADRQACDRLIKSCGDIDVLVNCAGVLETATVETSGEDLWHRVMEVNVTAPWRLARGLLPGLRRRRGVIVNVSSDAGLLGYSQNAVYCASKGALIGLTRALAVELSGEVRVLCVCPGPVDTDMMRSAVAREPDPRSSPEVMGQRSAAGEGRLAGRDCGRNCLCSILRLQFRDRQSDRGRRRDNRRQAGLIGDATSCAPMGLQINERRTTAV